jgi:hypothetical protein
MRYLKHKKTGRVYVHTDLLAKHPDLEEVGGSDKAPEKAPKPADKAHEPAQQEAVIDVVVTDSGEVRIGDADKDDLAAYAERHFGTKLDKRKSIADLADQVRELIKTHGHPDFD